MKRIYSIEVDCANCANKMEAAISSLDGVESAAVNFMAAKLNVEFCDGANEADMLLAIKKVCKKIDSDFDIR